MGKYQNGNGYSYDEDLPERGPGAREIFEFISRQNWTGGTWMQRFTLLLIADIERNYCCSWKLFKMMMCQSNFIEYFFFFPQLNRWFTGAMLRSQESFSALDLLSFSPCPCSRSSASSRTCRSSLCLEPFHSESTRPSRRLFRRHLKAIPSSKLTEELISSDKINREISENSWISTWHCHQKRFRTSLELSSLTSTLTPLNCAVFSLSRTSLTHSSLVCSCICWLTLGLSLMAWPSSFLVSLEKFQDKFWR